MITGCSSPVYTIVNDYFPPENELGLNCIKQNCQTKLEQCNNDCQKIYQICLSKAEIKASEAYRIEASQYQMELLQYQIDKNIYDRQLSHYHKRKDKLNYNIKKYSKYCREEQKHKESDHRDKQENCETVKYYKHQLKHLDKPDYIDEPHQPSLIELTKEFQSSCDQHCQCTPNYNQCYVSCGGQVQSRRLCTANCEDD